MAITKSSASFTWATGSSTASGTTNAISTSTYYAQQIAVSIVVVGTPTGAATFSVQWSPDGTTFYALTTLSTPLVAGTYNFTIDLPVACESTNIVYTAQTGGTSSTLTAQLAYVSAV